VTSAVSPSRLIGSSSSAEFQVRPELLVHALAQLPDDVCLEIGNPEADTARLALLAKAYGIGERVSMSRTGSPGADQPIAGPGAGAKSPTMAELVEGLTRSDDRLIRSRGDDGLLGGERVGLITNLPAPYRVPLFNAMARRLEAVDAAFRVFFLARGSRTRSWMNVSGEEFAFDYSMLPSLELPVRARATFAPLSLERRLADLKPTLLVSAGFSPLVSGRIAAIARRRKVSFGVWSGEHATMATATGRVRRIQRRRLVAGIDFAIAYGHAAGEYLRTLRPDLPLVYGRNTSFSDAGNEARATGRPIRVVAVGDLASPRKGIDILIDALRLSPDLPVQLTVVGGGKLLSKLARSATKDDRIRLLGSLPPASVRAQYTNADVFAFPSRADVFGLALVEAMGFGLATVTSRSPGAVADLCVHGHNCLLAASHEPEVWAQRLAQLADDHDFRRALGLRAQQTVTRRWTLDHASDAMLAGLRLGILTRSQRGHS
jgi:hypothetical protein